MYDGSENDDMDEPLVSIIVPVYNSGVFLDYAVESIINQTYVNLEVLLVDDGSTDESGSICDTYALRDGRIQSYHITNHGVSYARNYGLEHAHGEYVQFVDADDKIPENFVEVLVKSIIKENSDVAFCGVARIYEDSESMNRLENRVYSTERYLKALYEGRISTTSSCVGLYKMKIIHDNRIKFPVELSCGEDAVFVLEYVKYAQKISSVEDTVYIYRQDRNFSATKHIHYDHYQLEQKRYNDVCGMVEDKNVLKLISFWYMDMIIRELVLYTKYAPESRQEIKRKLKAFVSDSNTKMAIRCYHRSNPAKSYWIPVAIRLRCVSMLYFLLKRRKIRINEQQSVKSVWN